VTGPARLAPVYDLVSTVPYLPKDTMALTLNGSTNWPDLKALTRLGQTRCDLSLPVIKTIIEKTADVLANIAPDIARYFRDAATHHEVGARLLDAWETGIRDSLGFAGRHLTSPSSSKSSDKKSSGKKEAR
jgi:serine/threonine-protein kinase HipA